MKIKFLLLLSRKKKCQTKFSFSSFFKPTEKYYHYYYHFGIIKVDHVVFFLVEVLCWIFSYILSCVCVCVEKIGNFRFIIIRILIHIFNDFDQDNKIERIFSLFIFVVIEKKFNRIILCPFDRSMMMMMMVIRFDSNCDNFFLFVSFCFLLS